jgi:hypothetical protein
MPTDGIYVVTGKPKNVPLKVTISGADTIRVKVERRDRYRDVYLPPGSTIDHILNIFGDQLEMYAKYDVSINEAVWHLIADQTQEAMGTYFAGVWVWDECGQSDLYVATTKGDDGPFEVAKLFNGRWSSVSDAGRFIAYFVLRSKEWVIYNSSNGRVSEELGLRSFLKKAPHSQIFVRQSCIDAAWFGDGDRLDDVFFANGSFHIIHPDSAPARLRAAITWREGKSGYKAKQNLCCDDCSHPADTWREGCICLTACESCATQSPDRCTICGAEGSFFRINLGGSPVTLVDLKQESAYLVLPEGQAYGITDDEMMQRTDDWFVFPGKFHGDRDNDTREAYMIENCPGGIRRLLSLQDTQPVYGRVFVNERVWERISREFQHLLCLLSKVFVCDEDVTYNIPERIRLHVRTVCLACCYADCVAEAMGMWMW